MTEQQQPAAAAAPSPTPAPSAACGPSSDSSPPPPPPAGQSWYYVDDSQEVQGPFPTSQMLAWYDGGFFSPLQACRAASSDVWLTMAAVFPATHRENTERETTAAVETKDGIEGEKEEKNSGEQEARGEEKEKADERRSASSLSSSPSAHSWYYEDESGSTQGPFPASHMSAWHAAGYFRPHTPVRRDDEPSMTQLQHRAAADFITDSITQPAATAASASASASSSGNSSSTSSTSPSTSTTAAAPQYYRPAAGEQDWYYTDNSGVERGPFSTSQMRYWHAKGFFTYNRCPVRLATQPRSAALPLHLHALPPAFTVSASAAAPSSAAAAAAHDAPSSAPLLSPDVSPALPLPPPPPAAADAALARPRPSPSAARQLQDAWHYIDTQGQVQGPFSTAQMAAWWAAGHIPASVQLLQLGDTGWRTVEQRGADCAFVTAASAAAAAGGGAALYGQTVMLGAGKAVSAGSGVVTTRRDIGDHYYDHEAWQHGINQKRQRTEPNTSALYWSRSLLHRS